MPALIAGANALASVPRLASRRGIRTDAVPAVAPTPDRVACRVVFGARKHRGRFLAFAGRDVTTRVAPVTGYVSTPEFWTHITKPGENLNFIGMDYGVSVDALRQANGLRHATGDVIYESQEIRVPVTDANRGKIELIHAKAIVAAEQAASTLAAAQRGDGNKNKGNQKQAAAKKEKEANGAKSLGADKSSQTFTNDANATWRAPYRLMRPREVTALTRADVEQMMPGAHGPVPPGLEHLQGLRDVDVMLLVETPECEWCAKLRPTWRQLAETTGPNTRVCVFTTTSQTDKAWADTYLAANAFPTVIAMPTKGGVYKFVGTDRTLPTLRAFADAAFKQGAPSTAASSSGKQSVESAQTTMDALAPSMEIAGAVERALVGVVGVGPASVVGDAVASMSPFALFGFGVALFLSTLRKLLASVLFASRQKRSGKTSSERYYENESDAALGSSQEDEDAEIPRGASPEKLNEWAGMVEHELGDVARRFLFLAGAWFRLRKRMWGDRFLSPGRRNAR